MGKEKCNPSQRSECCAVAPFQIEMTAEKKGRKEGTSSSSSFLYYLICVMWVGLGLHCKVSGSSRHHLLFKPGGQNKRTRKASELVPVEFKMQRKDVVDDDGDI